MLDTKPIKAVLSILFFLCLLDNMPYEYYKVLRLSAFCGFIILSCEAYINKKYLLVFTFTIIAIIFLSGKHFEKETWRIIDTAIGIYLLLSAYAGKWFKNFI